MKEVNAPTCEQREELINFLYGELGDSEAKRFQNHLHECAACTEELNAFSGVRRSVIAWRNDTLGAIPVAAEPVALHDRRSALAALRAFFDFSPLWLKGAAAVAVLLFCVLVGFSVRNFQRTNPPSIPVTAIVQSPSQSEVNAMVERRVQEELNRREKAATPGTAGVAISQDAVKNRRSLTNKNPVQIAQRPLSRSERAELAADLRLVSPRRDSEDLLDDGINR